jgi:hypothetical protein
MFKWIKRLFKPKRKRIGMSKAAADLYKHKMPRFKIRQERPPFPGGTFVYPDSWYEAWEKDLEKMGWTKKELKQGWRWRKL